MKRPGTSAGGFSLVEVMVAVFFTSLSMAGTTGLVSGILRGNAFSATMTAAVTLAQDKIDELHDMRFSAMDCGADQHGRFHRAWTVSTDDNRKEVMVRVHWSSSDGAIRQATLSTLVCQ